MNCLRGSCNRSPGNPEAMKRFCALPEGVKEQQVARARGIQSRAEMDALVREF